MAILQRRGPYQKFNPTKLLPGEVVAVLEGDPSSSDGRAVYACFAVGLVKRVATYEDMLDQFQEIKESTVDWIVNTANADFKVEYIAIRDEAKAAEQTRQSNEAARVTVESSRAAAEASRVAAENARAAAEAAREQFVSNLEQSVEDGDFSGATFTPTVSEEGVLSWANDKGLANPTTVNIKGEKGNDGVVTQLAAGMFALQIEGNNLVLTYGDDTTPPDLEIGDDGCLYIEIGD